MILTLDVGCGESKRGTIGVDTGKFKGVDVVADAHFLPFRSKVFDYIFFYHVLEHVEQPIRAVREIFRALKDGGGLEVQVPKDSRMKSDTIAHFLDFDFKAAFRQYNFLKSGAHKWQFSEKGLISLLRKQGFLINSIKYVAKPVTYGRKGKLLFRVGIRRYRNVRIYAAKQTTSVYVREAYA